MWMQRHWTECQLAWTTVRSWVIADGHLLLWGFMGWLCTQLNSSPYVAAICSWDKIVSASFRGFPTYLSISSNDPTFSKLFTDFAFLRFNMFYRFNMHRHKSINIILPKSYSASVAFQLWCYLCTEEIFKAKRNPRTQDSGFFVV